MKKLFSASFLMVALLLVQSQGARCEGDGVPEVAYLAHMSDVIVVGTGSLESLSGQNATIAIQVNRTIKGKNIAQQIHIPLTIVSPMCSIQKDAPPVNAIWFLRYLPDGTLTFGLTPKSQSCHPLSNDYEVEEGPLPARWVYSDSLLPKDKLAYELAASVDAHGGNGPYVFSINQLVLGTVGESAGTDIYQKLAASSVVNVNLLGKLGLVSLGDPDQLRVLSGNITALSNLPIQSSFVKGNRTFRVSSSTGYDTYEFMIAKNLAAITNAKNATVQELGALVQNPSASERVRFAAARALRNLHTSLAVTFLAPLLWDKDAAIRAEAIGGLGCFANNMPVINAANPAGSGVNLNLAGPYKSNDTAIHFTLGSQTLSKNEPYYLAFWQQWWSTNGASVSAQAKSST